MISEVKNIDCMLAMKEFPDKFFELAIVDPPYGIKADEAQTSAAEQRIKANGKSKAGRGYKLYKKSKWDESIPNEEYFEELFRISKNQIIWGGNYMTAFLPASMGWIVWNKMQREFSLADGEMAWTSFDIALRIFDFSRGQAIIDNNIGLSKFHPTTKPITLYKWLLKNYAKEGDKILDTHLGSGSSRIAAYDMGFDFWGYELDKDYFDASVKRFEQFKAQTKLFA